VTGTGDSAPASGPHRSNPAIDGLRAFAVLGVMAVHSGVPGAKVGWLGVDLFFVLSGFLITTLLVEESRRNGSISLTKFWGRRFLRLMPAYWLYAAFITIAFAGVHWGWQRDHGGTSTTMYLAGLWLYFINLLPFGGIWEHQSLTLHLWSLAVEEQFYLLWPALCFVFLPRQRLETVAWVLVTLVLVRHSTCGPGPLLSQLDTRGFAIVLGCAVALRLGRDQGLRTFLVAPRPRVFVAAAMLLGVFVMSVAAQRGLATEVQLHRFGVPLLALCFALFISQLWLAPEAPIARALSWGPLVYLGKISYGMYLYHMLAHYLTWELLLADMEDSNRWLKFGLRSVVFCALTVAIAALSHHYVEKRFLVMKARFR
jgi:peptidoglycan/LPS O-acetylase OafA/YrhL